MTPAATSPYLTVAEAVEYLRFPSANALYIARHRHQLRGYKRGGKLLFKTCDLDAFLERDSAELEAFQRQSRSRRSSSVHTLKVVASGR